jgi:hypothetical protein
VVRLDWCNGGRPRRVEVRLASAGGDPAFGFVLEEEGLDEVAEDFALVGVEAGGGVCEVVRCHVWLGQTKGAMTHRGSTVRRPCSALLPG